MRAILLLISFLAAVAGLGLGALVMYGWHTGNWGAVHQLPTFAPMQYSAALSFVLCGIALLLLLFQRNQAAAIVGIFPVIIGILSLVKYVVPVDLGLDSLLIQHDIIICTLDSDPTSISMAIGFTLLGSALALPLFLDMSSHQIFTRAVLVSLALGLGVLALFGHFIGLQEICHWGNAVHMSLQSSIGLILLSLGLLAFVWSKELHEEVPMPNWFVIPITITVFMITICFWQMTLSAKPQLGLQDQQFPLLVLFPQIVLISGMILALAIATTICFVRKSLIYGHRLNRLNQTLEKAIDDREQAESTLQVQKDHLDDLAAVWSQKLERTQHEAESLQHAKNQFLSQMSTKLQKPVRDIFCNIQLLQRDPNTTISQKQKLQIIADRGAHILSLIENVLELSKVEMGKFKVANEVIDLHHLIHIIAGLVNKLAQKKGLTFHADIAPDVPFKIRTDPEKLKQILLNLLDNSIKFTDKGGIMLQVTRASAHVLNISIADTGMGMHPEDRNDIFQPFKQTRSGEFVGGMGLGLSVTRRLVEAMKGSIAVES
ncbi:MAG: HAMP domain-containing sensor histidine kinase, partial [Planctomycetia bacterium]